MMNRLWQSQLCRYLLTALSRGVRAHDGAAGVVRALVRHHRPRIGARGRRVQRVGFIDFAIR